MSNSIDETNRLYERDEVTNRFLKRHPVHCEFRTGELLRKSLHFHEGVEIYLCLGGGGALRSIDGALLLEACNCDEHGEREHNRVHADAAVLPPSDVED